MTLNPSEVLVVNKMAPVEAWVRTDLGGKRKKFKSWYDFTAWFDPRYHGHMNLPPNSQEKFTDVLVDTLTDSPRRRAKPISTEPRETKSSSQAGKRNQGVTLDGKSFPSLAKAFVFLGWELDGKFQRFRKDLKAKLSLTYEGHQWRIE